MQFCDAARHPVCLPTKSAAAGPAPGPAPAEGVLIIGSDVSPAPQCMHSEPMATVVTPHLSTLTAGVFYGRLAPRLACVNSDAQTTFQALWAVSTQLNQVFSLGLSAEAPATVHISRSMFRAEKCGDVAPVGAGLSLPCLAASQHPHTPPE